MATSTQLNIGGAVAVAGGVGTVGLTMRSAFRTHDDLDVSRSSFASFRSAVLKSPNDEFLLGMARTELDLLDATKRSAKLTNIKATAGMVGGFALVLGGMGAFVGAALVDA